MELTVNLENLSDDERENLMALVKKSAKPKTKVWKPKVSEIYYFVSSDGGTYADCNNSTNLDKARWELGNCYRTKEEAEFALQHQLVEVELHRYAEEHNDEETDNDDRDVFFIHYGIEKKKLGISWWCGEETISSSTVFFTESEIAQSAIDTIGEERLIKYYFGIKN